MSNGYNLVLYVNFKKFTEFVLILIRQKLKKDLDILFVCTKQLLVNNFCDYD